jgi:hypothetical protein
MAWFIGVMGMDLFAPPDVSGWFHGRNWLGASSVVVRYNWAHWLAHYIMVQPDVLPLVDAMPVSNSDNEGIASYFSDLLFHEPLTTENTNHLIDFVNGIPLNGVEGDPVLEKRRKIQATVHVMLTMPSAHLK